MRKDGRAGQALTLEQVLRGFQGIFGPRGWLHLDRPLSRQRIADTVKAAT